MIRFILIQNPYNQDKVKAFTENQMEDAVNCATEIFAKNYQEELNINIYHLSQEQKHDFYSAKRVRGLITKYILYGHPEIYCGLKDFVYIYVVKK